MKSSVPIIGVIIAGGKSSRMRGNEKCLLDLNGQPIISEIIQRFEPQTDQIIINANGDTSRFDFTGLTIIKDSIDGQQGPLAGIYSAMTWVRNNISEHALIACIPSDAPFIPQNLVKELHHSYINEKSDIACAITGEQLHPVFNLMPVSLHGDLHQILTTTKMRAIYKWFQKYNLAKVSFPQQDSVDPFFNINTAEELEKARTYSEKINSL